MILKVRASATLLDIEPGRDPEESLESCHAHDVSCGAFVRLHRGYHGSLNPLDDLAAPEPSSN
jgi:hypothetical protein